LLLSRQGGREAHWCYRRGKEEETDGIMLLMLYNITTTTITRQQQQKNKLSKTSLRLPKENTTGIV
jgi:hypothetical protein